MTLLSRASLVLVCSGCFISSSASCTSAESDSARSVDGLQGGCPSGAFALSSPLVVSTERPMAGDVVRATVTYTNQTGAAVAIKDVVIACRPPGGGHAQGPYEDFAPTRGSSMIAPGASITLESARTFKSSDPAGQWEVYATYEDEGGTWHDAASSIFLSFAGSAAAPPPGVSPPGALTPPPAAAAAGYTRLAFDEEFTSTAGIDMDDTGAPGFNFYRRLPFGYPTLPTSGLHVADSVLTLDSQTGPNMGLVSLASDGAGGFHGFAPTGGAYFEASVSFDPDAGGQGWPSFWSMAAEHLYGNATEFIEADFFEYDTTFAGTHTFGGAMHRWSRGGITYTNPNFVTSVPSTTDWKGTFNTVGALWTVGAGIDIYFNDASTTNQTSYRDNPLLEVGDGQHWPVILGSDGWPMRVDWVRVWTK